MPKIKKYKHDAVITVLGRRIGRDSTQYIKSTRAIMESLKCET